MGGNASTFPFDINRSYFQIRRTVSSRSRRLKQLASKAFETTLVVQEMANLKDRFDPIGLNQDGAESLEEILNAFGKYKPQTPLLFTAVDFKEDSMVNLNECIAATHWVYQLEGSI